jgi:hypothetical protein
VSSADTRALAGASRHGLFARARQTESQQFVHGLFGKGKAEGIPTVCLTSRSSSTLFKFSEIVSISCRRSTKMLVQAKLWMSGVERADCANRARIGSGMNGRICEDSRNASRNRDATSCWQAKPKHAAVQLERTRQQGRVVVYLRRDDVKGLERQAVQQAADLSARSNKRCHAQTRSSESR